jgi:sulfur relay protein TusB/DsrH
VTTLHLAFSASGLASCERRRREGDVVVLLGDGVYAAMGSEPLANAYVLACDLEARGAVNKLDLASITYDGLVSLCTQHHPIVSWNN